VEATANSETILISELSCNPRFTAANAIVYVH
jgi:hypothetical protein